MTRKFKSTIKNYKSITTVPNLYEIYARLWPYHNLKKSSKQNKMSWLQWFCLVYLNFLPRINYIQHVWHELIVTMQPKKKKNKLKKIVPTHVILILTLLPWEQKWWGACSDLGQPLHSSSLFDWEENQPEGMGRSFCETWKSIRSLMIRSRINFNT